MNIKIAIVSFISCAIGCSVGFIFGEKLTKKKADRHAQVMASRVLKREIDNDGIRVEVEGSDWAAREVRRANMEERKAQIAHSWEINPAKKIQEENGYSAEEEPIDSNEVSTDEYLASHEHPDDGDTDGDLLNIVPDRAPEDYIYIIDVDEYETEEEYEHVEVTYYEEDEVFCDEDEKRIEDPEQIFGKNVDDLFGRNPVNPDDVIYIKNTWFEKVYQITRIHNSYGRVVLGLDD